MGIKVRIPNSGSTYTSSACVVSSCGNDVWLGYSVPPTSSGCVVFYRNSSSVSGSEIATVAACPGQTIFFPYPFNSPTGIYIATGSGGSAFAWVTV